MATPKLIGLIGLKQHGKSTVGRLLAQNHGYGEMQFVQPLKWVVANVLGISPDDLEDAAVKGAQVQGYAEGVTPRKILRVVGTEGFRAVDPGFWVSTWARLYAEVLRGFEQQDPPIRDKGIVVTDCRFQNEVTAIQRRGGEIWLVDMPPKTLPTQAEHASEALALEWTSVFRQGGLAANVRYVPLMYSDPGDNPRRVAEALGV